MSLLSVDGIMFPKIAELVKEAKTEKDGDKCIFGVYTKWDKFENKQKKTKAGNFPVDVKYLREHHNQKFLEKVCEKKKTAAKAEEDEEEEDEEEKVFFVDVGCEETFNVSILIRIRSNIVIICFTALLPLSFSL